jgi:putative acetyltransferase
MKGLPPHRLRRATAADVPALAALYRDVALALAPQAYASEQVAAWAAFGADTPAFRDYVLEPDTWVAESDGQPIAFCGIDDAGEVRSLYVRADLTRCGLGGALLTHAIDDATARRGIGRFKAWATVFSRPVFERHRFRLLEVVDAEYGGVSFERARLER